MTLVAPREDRVPLALGLMALAVVCFTMIDSSAKWLVTAGLPAIQVVFVRYAVHLALALALFVPAEGRGAFVSNAPGLQAMRAFCLFGSTILNFSSLAHLPITVTTTIMFAGPVVVTLLAVPMLHERVDAHRMGAVLAGFGGVLVVMQPWGAGWHPAMLLSLGALTLASLYFVLTRLLAGREANSTSQIWAAGLATLCLAPFAALDWTWPAAAADWAFFGAIGLFGGTGHILAVAAHRYAGASILAPVVYIQLGLAAAASVVLFGVWPTAWTLGGGAIIVAAGLWIWRHERAGQGASSST